MIDWRWMGRAMVGVLILLTGIIWAPIVITLMIGEDVFSGMMREWRDRKK